jgi:hypothetical protein
MTTRIPMSLTLAALLGFASPALAAAHTAKQDPQVATTTAKGHTHKSSAAKTTSTQVKGRHATASKANKTATKTAAATRTAPTPQPATK